MTKERVVSCTQTLLSEYLQQFTDFPDSFGGANIGFYLSFQSYGDSPILGTKIHA
jgi:hypothetical protein